MAPRKVSRSAQSSGRAQKSKASPSKTSTRKGAAKKRPVNAAGSKGSQRKGATKPGSKAARGKGRAAAPGGRGKTSSKAASPKKPTPKKTTPKKTAPKKTSNAKPARKTAGKVVKKASATKASPKSAASRPAKGSGAKKAGKGDSGKRNSRIPAAMSSSVAPGRKFVKRSGAVLAQPRTPKASIRTPAGAEELKARIGALSRAVSEIRNLKRSLVDTFWEVGEALAAVDVDRLYEVKGYVSLETFIDRELGMSKRIGNSLRQMPELLQRPAAESAGLDRSVAAVEALVGKSGGASSSG